MQTVLPLLLFFLFIFEGLGIQSGREITYLLLIFLLPVLFIHFLFRNKKIYYPKKTTILFSCFLITIFTSTLFSINISNSIQFLLLFVSLFFAFILSYNYGNQLEKPMTNLIFSLSFLFILYTLFLNFQVLNLFLPQNGYQFVYSRLGSHNHLGDFLTLPIIISIYNLYNRKRVILSLALCLLLLPIVLLSYSRSAYLTIALTTVFIHIYYLQKKHSLSSKLVSRIVILITILTAGFFIIATTYQAGKQPISSVVNKELVKKGNLKYKDISGNRPEYARQAVLSIQKHPIFGVGPNNFLLVSKQYSPNISSITETAHNIILEILVGQGLLGFITFALLILIVLIKSQKNALFFVFLAMLINFQTDYTYQIYSFLLLFFALAGSVIKRESFFILSSGRRI